MKSFHLPLRAIFAAVLFAPLCGMAQGYPAKPVRLIVPFAAGGSVDIIGRTMGQVLTQALGQSFVADNRPGAGGLLAMDAVAKAPADGYTLGVGSAGPLTVAPAIHRDRNFDPLSQLEPIVLFANTPGAIFVRNDLPATSVRELLELSKSSPGKLTMASAGSGSVLHLIGEYFQSANGIKWTHIPYKGSGPALIDIVAGRVDVLVDSPPSAAPHVRAGKLRVLAITAQKRSSLLPQVSTLEEQGYRGYDMGSWMGLVAPKGTSPEIVNRLNAELLKALATPEMRERLVAAGAEPEGGTPQRFALKIKGDLAQWTEVINRAGIRPD
jgi:tripartite-type tricarboxylate transporter receptor subunit TctC